MAWGNGAQLGHTYRRFRVAAHRWVDLVDLVPELDSTRNLQSIGVSDHGGLRSFALALDHTPHPPSCPTVLLTILLYLMSTGVWRAAPRQTLGCPRAGL